MKQAILVEPLAVAVHCVKKSGLQVGQTVFIIGGGPIGVITAIVARLNGASEVVISEPNEYRIDFARKLGFTVIDSKNTDVLQEVKTMTKGRGFDVVFEVSGSQAGAELMTGCAKTSGTIVIVGVPYDRYPIDSGLILAKELQLKGVRIHAQINFLTAVKIMESGVLKDQLAPFIDTEFDLDQLNEAMKFSLEDQKHFKILIKI
jgi:threonine dehydrogenase-like Zn-dependent dehydrogenase